MGAGESTNVPPILVGVKQSVGTKYTMTELQKWYGRFEKECPHGYLTKPEFKELYSKFYPGTDAAAFADHNFRLFDVDNDKKIDFSEFMISLGLQCRGNAEEKLDWMFSLFDIDNDGRIKRAEMAKILKSLYKIDTEKKLGKSPNAHVEKLYKLLDSNNDGEICKSEFLKLENNDPQLMEMICGYGMGS